MKSRGFGATALAMRLAHELAEVAPDRLAVAHEEIGAQLRDF